MQPYEELEVALARWAGCAPECMVVCSSGTAALHLALEALHLPSWAEVVACDLNMVAVPRAISLADLTPVFVDCTDGLLIDADLIDEAIAAFSSATSCGDSVRAVVATHLYGRAAPMAGVHALAAKYGLLVVEDLAECHGVRPHARSDAACWSFFENKIVHGEEGGAVCFRDPQKAALARQLRCLGFTDAHDFAHVPRGHNYRMSNAHALPILASLSRVEESLAARRQIEGWYEAHCPGEWQMPPRDVVWVFDVRIPGLTRRRQGAIVKALNDAGIAARMSFLPMSAQEEYRFCRKAGGERALAASEEVFYLPAMPGTVTEETAALAFEVIHRALRG